MIRALSVNLAKTNRAIEQAEAAGDDALAERLRRKRAGLYGLLRDLDRREDEARTEALRRYNEDVRCPPQIRASLRQ